MVDPSEPDEKLNPDQRSAAARFAIFFLSVLIFCLVVIVSLAFFQRIYWDQNQQDAIFMWDAFLFFLTKSSAVKFGGATFVALIGALITAATGFFKGKRAVGNVTWLCTAGIVLTVILWIMLSQDEELFGEVSALANDAFVRSPPEARISQVSGAIDSLMGAFLVWWIVTVATVLGLRAALTGDKFAWFQGFFSRS